MSRNDADATGEESFLRRWHQRKLAATEHSLAGKPAEMLREGEGVAPAASPVADPEPAPGDEDMPALETLNETSDYSGFFSPKVSEQLRRAALRKLFHLPGFNIVDGLNDYDEDYTRFEPLGDVLTHEMLQRLQGQANSHPETADTEQVGLAQAEGQNHGDMPVLTDNGSDGVEQSSIESGSVGDMAEPDA